MKIRKVIMLGINIYTVLFLSAVSLVSYTFRKVQFKKTLEAQLTNYAHLAQQILPIDFHDQIKGLASVSPGEYQKNSQLLRTLCLCFNLDQFWSLLETDGGLVITSSSAATNDLDRQSAPDLFRVSANSAAYHKAFDTMEIQFQEIENEQGEQKVVFVPSYDAHGRKYLFGASVKLATVQHQRRAMFIHSLWIDNK